MNIYNTQKYNQGKYSTGNPVHKQGHLYYGSVIAGISVRGQIGKKFIYRVRPGNGFYGAERGVRYQDRFNYFVPSSIMHPAGNQSRACFADAVAAWKALPIEDQLVWEKMSKQRKNIRGRFMFIGHYMTSVYV